MLKLTRNGLNSAGALFFFSFFLQQQLSNQRPKLVKDMPEPENWTNLGVKKRKERNIYI